MIASVPGLDKLLTKDETKDGIEVYGCTAGCHYAQVWMKPFWVDFANKTIIHDTRNTPCSAPGAQAGGGTAVAGTATRSMVTHPRVPVTSVVSHLSSSLSVPRCSFLKDERLNRFLSDGKRSALLDAHETPPDSFRAHVSRLLIMISEAQAAIALGKAAGARLFSTPPTSSSAASSSARAPSAGTEDTKIMDYAVSVRTMIASSSSDKVSLVKDKTVTFAVLTRNEMALAIVSRGLHEYVNWAAYVAWSGTYGSKVKANALLREIHDSLLFDLATISDAILTGVAISDRLESVWDSNVFHILGALIFRKDDSGISAFYRQERALRFDALCTKKFGWKPATADPSGGGGRQHDRDAADDGDEAPSNPRKRGRDGGGGGGNPRKGDTQGDPKKLRKGGNPHQRRIQLLQKELRDARKSAKDKASGGGGGGGGGGDGDG